MSRLLIFIYGIFSYLLSFGLQVWFILFIGGWSFLPLHVDSGTPGSLSTALVINTGLIILFGLQHSVMARPRFKAQLTKIIPHAAERSTYVLLSGVMMGLFCLYWQPIDGVLWHIDNSIGQIVFIVAYVLGWVLAIAATFLINHFELFGLQQVYYNLINKPEPAPNFTEKLFYRVVRHPLQLGILIGIWSTPTMSMTHFMLAATMSVYIFIGLYYEEKDLVATLGKNYSDYQERVRMIVPIPK